MKTWFTSDNHFGHTNIIKFCNRPFKDVEEMNREMIIKWNSVVDALDTVYLLGDFSFINDINKTISILNQLNGIKHFTFGNHDKEIHILNCRLDLKNIQPFQSYADYREINIEKQFIVLCHYAMRAWNRSARGSWMLFGHTHNTLAPYGKSVDVGVDSTAITGKAEYRPFSFEEIKKFMDKKEIIKNFSD